MNKMSAVPERAKSATRRRGGKNAKTRAALIAAAERLMVEEGYASVTTRKLAAKAGLKSQLVHYYFDSIDAVFVAVIRSHASKILEGMVEMVTLEEPFEAIWRLGAEKDAVIFWQELLALANHREAVRDEVQHYMEQKRLLEAAALERTFKLSGIKTDTSPIAWILLIGGVSQILRAESTLGLSAGHRETRELLHRILRNTGLTFDESPPEE